MIKEEIFATILDSRPTLSNKMLVRVKSGSGSALQPTQWEHLPVATVPGPNVRNRTFILLAWRSGPSQRSLLRRNVCRDLCVCLCLWGRPQTFTFSVPTYFNTAALREQEKKKQPPSSCDAQACLRPAEGQSGRSVYSCRPQLAGRVWTVAAPHARTLCTSTESLACASRMQLSAFQAWEGAQEDCSFERKPCGNGNEFALKIN